MQKKTILSFNLAMSVRRCVEYIVTARWTFLEFGIVFVVWYGMFGRLWNANFLPLGGEYARSMSPFFVWETLKSCVVCSFWAPHGGGKPIWADPFGSFLHPLSMVLSVLFGAIAGSSYTQSVAFLLMGMAAWWFAHMLRLHPFVRVWFTIAAMIGGHMVCRIEIGSIGLPLSFASACLAFVGLYWYGQAPSLRRAVAVGVLVGALLTAGQMYYQYYFVLVVLLWGIYLLRTGYGERNPAIGKHAAVAGVIAMLMAAPLILNLVMTSGIYGKLTDVEMKYSIPIGTQLVNLVIPTAEVAKTSTLNPFPYPYAYATYIGLVPCIAALLWYGRIIEPLHRVIARYVGLGGGLAAVLATGVFSKWVISLENETLTYIASAFRFIVLYNGFLAMALLVLAALGAHAFLTTPSHPHAVLDGLFEWIRQRLSVDLRVAAIVVIGTYHLLSLQSYAGMYVGKVPTHDPKTALIRRDLVKLTDGYIDIPNWLLLNVMENGGLASTYFSSVTLEGRKFPPPQYLVTQKIPETIPTTVLQKYEGDWFLVRNDAPQEQYAAVQTMPDTWVPCAAAPQGGVISVRCETPSGGTVRLLVNAIPGWEYAAAGDAFVPAPVGEWLTAPIGAGTQTITFRYAPWYAWAALFLIPVPWIVVIAVLWYDRRRPSAYPPQLAAPAAHTR